MKILKAYRNKKYIEELPYSGDCPLMNKLRELYDVDEIILETNYKEEDYAELIRKYDVLLTMWSSPHVPNELADNPGNLKYICNITGSISGWIDAPIVESPHITITNWGDAAGYGIAEGAISLLMTMLKDIPLFISCARENKDRPDWDTRRVGTLFQTNIGIYGMGYIGRKFVEYLRPFMPEIYAFDPYVENMPEGVTKVDSLEELFSKSQIVAIHAGLSEETKGTVTKELLAMLPDGGIIINTARGPIINESALLEEIKSGRLRAGLDVMDQTINPDNGDMPKLNDPVRQVNNAVFTGHHIGGKEWSQEPGKLDFGAFNCQRNLAHFVKGEPLEFVIDITRYNRMT